MFVGLMTCSLALVVSVGAQERAESEPPASTTERAGAEVASESVATAQQATSSNYPDPNTIPYRTERSLLEQFFALPAKVWRLAWMPVEKTVIWVEHEQIHEKAINFFLNAERTGGFYPLVNFGGSLGLGGGVTVFHNDLFDQGKQVNVTFLYGSTDNNIVTFTYADSTLFGSRFYLSLLGEFFNDSDENVFVAADDSLLLNGNTTTLDHERSYATRQGDMLLTLGYSLNRRVGLGVTAGFQRARIEAGTGRGGDIFLQTNLHGIGTTSLGTFATRLTLDFRNGWPRTLSGTLLQLEAAYHRELAGDRFEYARYAAELQQFLPVPFLPKDRRLAVRARLEKAEPLNGKAIPFYKLSMLGDAANLRGFDQNRFRGRGLLLFNFEYRYPIWDTWDAVIFVDEGQVFNDFDDIGFEALHFAAGTGVRIMTRTGFVFRLEIGWSRETTRVLFELVPNF